MDRAPAPADRPLKSWPVFLMTRRRFRFRAKLTASWICAMLVAFTWSRQIAVSRSFAIFFFGSIPAYDISRETPDCTITRWLICQNTGRQTCSALPKRKHEIRWAVEMKADICPLSSNSRTDIGIVSRPGLVTGRSQGNVLDECKASQEIKDIPGSLGRPVKIPGVRFALFHGMALDATVVCGEREGMDIRES